MNFVQVTEASTLIEDSVGIDAVLVFWSGDGNASAELRVVFNATNRGKVAVAVITLEFTVYMDNVTDPRPFGERFVESRVGVGSYSVSPEAATPIPAGGVLYINLSVHVPAGSRSFDAFRVPDGGGRFHPFIPTSRVVVAFPDFPGVEPRLFFLPRPYYDPLGVRPIG